MSNTTMYDSVDVGVIPSDAAAVAGYVGGMYTTWPSLLQKFPHARKASIAVNSEEDADILDVEAGDATPEEAPAWFRRQISRASKGAAPVPGFYISLDGVNRLYRILQAAGIRRHEYRLWTADYDGTPKINGPHTVLPNGEAMATYADATQYWDKALGRNLDVSLCSPSMFINVQGGLPADVFVPHDEMNWRKEWDRIKARKTLAAHLRRLYLKARMVARERQIVKLSHAGGWAFRNRHARYIALFERTKTR